MVTSEKEETTTVSLILPTKIDKLVEDVSKARGEDKSTFMRRAIYKELAALSYLTEKNKKALGINQKENRRKG